MSWSDRMKESHERANAERKAELDRLKGECDQCVRLLQELRCLEFLRGIRDEIWGTGEISVVRRDDPRGVRSRLGDAHAVATLSVVWPEYVAGHWIGPQQPDDVDTYVRPEIVLAKEQVLAIKVLRRGENQFSISILAEPTSYECWFDSILIPETPEPEESLVAYLTRDCDHRKRNGQVPYLPRILREIERARAALKTDPKMQKPEWFDRIVSLYER